MAAPLEDGHAPLLEQALQQQLELCDAGPGGKGCGGEAMEAAGMAPGLPQRGQEALLKNKASLGSLESGGALYAHANGLLSCGSNALTPALSSSGAPILQRANSGMQHSTARARPPLCYWCMQVLLPSWSRHAQSARRQNDAVCVLWSRCAWPWAAPQGRRRSSCRRATS